MKQDRIILLFLVIAISLSILLITGVGYAVETENVLKIYDNPTLLAEQANFKIQFIGEPTYYGDGVAKINLTGPTSATMNITELTAEGDLITVTFVIANKSKGMKADINAKITNTNTEYFKVTSDLSESTIVPEGGQTILKVIVEVVKTPIYKEQKANICINICAIPREK